MNFLCKINLHKWKVHKNTGMYSYEECIKCSKRRIVEVRIGGYQPIDRYWIKEKSNMELLRIKLTKILEEINKECYKIDCSECPFDGIDELCGELAHMRECLINE